MTAVLLSSRRWKVTTPACSAPCSLVQAMRWSGVCSVMTASNSLVLAGHLRRPVRMRVVELADLLDALHELGELLELRPLVVRGADGDLDVDGLLDVGHGMCSFFALCGVVPGRPAARRQDVRPARHIGRPMPLTLVTGPANAEKARVVLGRLRAVLDREPILVVPTLPDVDRYRRELAEDHELVFGARVETFDRLLGEVARRAGVTGGVLGRLARERVAASAAARARLELLAGSAATPGFPGAACRLFDELEEDRIGPARFIAALRAWAAEDAARQTYADELGRLYGAYRAELDRLGRRDETLRHAAALDAIREAPGRWGTTPVLFYGFDDLSVLQRDAIAALAATDAEVTASLTYEPGRHAFAARGETVEALRPVAAEVVALLPNAEHYAPESRAALHALERGLFEEGSLAAARPRPARRGAAPVEADRRAHAVRRPRRAGARGRGRPAGGDPRSRAQDADDEARAGAAAAGDAIVFLEGGGERAELELVAAEVARLIRDEGVEPEEIAVVLRQPDEAAALLGQVFDAYGIPSR
jgi:hypothetical protein